MKLCLVIHTFNDTKGGKEIFTWNLVQELLEKDVRIDLVAAKYKKIDHPNLRYHPAKMWGKPLGIHRWTFALNARKVVNKLETEIIYTNGKAGFGDVVRLGGVPHRSHLEFLRNRRSALFSRMSFDAKKKLSISDRIALYLEKKTYCQSPPPYVVTASNLIKRELVKSYSRVHPGRIKVIYNGYDPGQFNLQKREAYRKHHRKKLKIPDRARVHIFVGNNFEIKGLPEVLDWLSHKEKNDYLIVVGRGKPIKTKPELAERIRWIGSVEDVAPYYACSDVLVFPSYSDGFGLIVLEALAMGLFTVVSLQAGASEIIEEENLGKTFQPGNLSEVNLPANLDTPKAIRERARFSRQFTWEKVAQRYYDYLQRVKRAVKKT